MHCIVKKSSLRGEISIPPSKSHTLRAILFGALGDGKSIIRNYLASPDAQAMIDACRSLGASIEQFPDRLEIQGLNGKITHAEDVINAGNSGIVLRFIAAVSALASLPIVITGDYSIRHQRPILPLLIALGQLGASAISTRDDGYAPIIIQGPLGSGRAEVAGEDSQPVSALLIASQFIQGPTEISVKNPGEKPWISLTLDWFDRLGLQYENKDFQTYRIKGGSRYSGFDYTVPGDLSSASFPLAASLVTGSELIIRNVDMSDTQGDKELIHVFKQMGGKIDIDETEHTLYIGKGSQLKGVDVDINDFIDSITILATVACYAEGTTNITNAAIARKKECDRLRCITQELRKMGGDITELEDSLVIKSSKLTGAHVYSHHDHRMAMSLAVAGMGCEGETHIEEIKCIEKTYPSFISDIRSVGANIRRGE